MYTTAAMRPISTSSNNGCVGAAPLFVVGGALLPEEGEGEGDGAGEGEGAGVGAGAGAGVGAVPGAGAGAGAPEGNTQVPVRQPYVAVATLELEVHPLVTQPEVVVNWVCVPQTGDV